MIGLDLLGDTSRPLPRPERQIERVEVEDALPGAAALAAGAAGALLWRDHRVLGFLLGASVGMHGFRAGRGDSSVAFAAAGVGTSVAAVGGSLLWKNHPVLGFLGGGIAGNLALAAASGQKMFWRGA